MREFFQQMPQETLTPDLVVSDLQGKSPDQVIQTAGYVSQLIRTEVLSPIDTVNRCVAYIEQSSQQNEHVNALLFLTCLRGKLTFWEGTQAFLEELRERHGFTDDFSLPFQKFVSQRLRITSRPQMRIGFEDIDDTKKMLDLLRQNGEFFEDLSSLQQFFTSNISPEMPLNATWNPALTKHFGVRNASGLWYIYSHGLRAEYLELMKEHLSPEWTGFNRFIQEPWETLKDRVNTQKHLVDIGSSIGITAMEIAQILDMQGSVLLLDYHNPHRDTSSLRIIDYTNPQRRLIPFDEAIERMEAIRGNRVVIQLFGVDVGKPLSTEVQGYLHDAALVHMGNVIPYIQQENLHQALSNTFEATSENGGIFRIHNDENLPIDSVITSLTIQKKANHVIVLRELTKGRF